MALGREGTTTSSALTSVSLHSHYQIHLPLQTQPILAPFSTTFIWGSLLQLSINWNGSSKERKNTLLNLLQRNRMRLFCETWRIKATESRHGLKPNSWWHQEKRFYRETFSMFRTQGDRRASKWRKCSGIIQVNYRIQPRNRKQTWTASSHKSWPESQLLESAATLLLGKINAVLH